MNTRRFSIKSSPAQPNIKLIREVDAENITLPPSALLNNYAVTGTAQA